MKKCEAKQISNNGGENKWSGEFKQCEFFNIIFKAV